MYNTLTIMYKDNYTPTIIKNVVQVDLSNMGENEFEEHWNFISVITKENNMLKKQTIALKEISQFVLVRDKEKINDN